MITKAQIYTVLKSRLTGTAKSQIEINNSPTEESYDEAMKILEELYVNKSFEIRDIYCKLKNIEPMSEKSSTKVAEFVTKSFSLIDQLMKNEPTIEELFFLLVSELLNSKLNEEASKKLRKIWKTAATEDQDDLALGHNLTIKDLKKILIETRDELQWKEYDDSLKKNNQNDDKAAQDKKKKAEEEKKKKDTLYGSHQTKSEEGNDKPKDKKSAKEGKCPIPKCQSSVDPTEGGHKYILRCPAMKKMKSDDLWSWFHSKKLKCQRCFSAEHSVDQCNLTKWKPCSKKITTGPRANEVCGSNDHCFWLHRDPKEQSNKKPNSKHSNQTNASQEGSSSGPKTEEQENSQ